MSQLRPEDSPTIVTMLHRNATENRNMSAAASPDADLGLHDNTATSSESTSELSKLPQMEIEFPEKDGECSSKAVVPRCPVCGKSLQWVGGNEVLLNRHVDECLNEVAVNDLLASDKQRPPVSR